MQQMDKRHRTSNISPRKGNTVQFIFQNNKKKLKMEDVVCKHFQSGYCKFLDHCRKHHITEHCQTKNCKLKACTKRHQKVCKFFTSYNVCKFGEQCSYKHSVTQEESDMSKLENKMSNLEDTVKVMSETIKVYLLQKLKEPWIMINHCILLYL